MRFFSGSTRFLHHLNLKYEEFPCVGQIFFQRGKQALNAQIEVCASESRDREF